MSETIIRTHKNKNNPYFVASKALFEDKRLSWAARGLMGYLLAKPDDWKIKVSDLQANGDCGRDGIKAILRELESGGYLYRQCVNKVGGKFDWLFEIYESPSLNPHAQSSPSPVEPSPVKASIYQIHNKLNNQVPNTHTHKATPAAPASDVRVCSKFSLAECRRFAEHLKAKGEGITNPGGYATSIYRSGEADAQIEQWLHPESAPRKRSHRACPDCEGRGVRYVDPANFDKGVVPCKHEKLAPPLATSGAAA